VSFRCLIRHVVWGHPESQERVLEKEVSIGREPRRGGLKIAPSDEFVSANAVQLRRKSTGVEIQNTSSHAQIEIHHSNGVRYLFPKESLTITQSSKIVIPSRDLSYSVEILIEGLDLEVGIGTHTRRLLPDDLVIAHERLPALAGLCANYLFPQHFGYAPLKASEISAYLKKKGLVVTPKAINHKIQRTREQVEEYTGNFIDDREGLAQFLIKNQFVTADDVKKYLLN
jgi:hypothetical protein